MADIASFVLNIFFQTVVLAPVLWFAGGKIASKKDVKFFDAVWIVVLGAIVSDVIGMLSLGFLGALAGFLIWLLLIKHFFDTGWIRSLAISIVATIILIVITAVLGLLGFGILILL